VLDVGGAAGIYARWLTELGYEVHLVDPVQEHVQAARASAPPIASARLGDARSLDRADESVDAVLLLGPLYHLTESEDRHRALAEAWRVLRPGGLVAAAAISRFASLLDGVMRDYLEDPRYAAIVERDLRDGQHRDATGRYFTTAYLHAPDELEGEVRDAGFVETATLAVEGIGGWQPEVGAWMADPARRDRLLAAIRAVEREPSLMGLGPHLLVIGRRPR
jgi:SAM-dependent methyltransferase